MRLFILLSAWLLAGTLSAQLLDGFEQDFDRCDSLRGALRPERTSFDVTFYDLDLHLNFEDSTLSGSNTVVFSVVEPTQRIQLDLFENMKIDSVVWLTDKENETLSFTRECNAVFIDWTEELKEGSKERIKVYYNGKPKVAENAPWDGGFTWTVDSNGNPWLGVSCQGIGASLWWPNKDHLSDEPDSMRISAIVPNTLQLISNGELEETSQWNKKEDRYTWFVSYPINNYNVTLNVGNYVFFSDTFVASDGSKLPLQYYVLPYNKEKAVNHFEQVNPMLACYEQYLGPYPFWNDGFALVETPYLGMEHQSAIAYGNQYKEGYAGFDYSRIGLAFDYIIIHEAGHEWWGNSVSVADIADLWIHEGFCTYTESIYVECLHGYEVAMDYINAKKPMIGNEYPMLGHYHVNHEGDGDMYNKGMLFLNTLRHVVNNDDLWWATLRKMTTERFFHTSTVTSKDVLMYFNEAFDMQLAFLFNQYVAETDIPVLLYKWDKKGKNDYTLSFKWDAKTDGFTMPVRYRMGKGDWVRVEGTETWQTIDFTSGKPSNLEWDTRSFYFDLKEVNSQE